jgi:L-2-hydroxyglutarate oxidase LhgO
VVGGGFAGATCARFLKQINPQLTVTLVEVNRTFTACPFTVNSTASFMACLMPRDAR